MSVWEYKVISSGKGGFATPALLESFLNQLGKDEWEIIEFRTPADNPLAFSGLARRPTQRDWTLQDAAAAAAKAEAEKLRAEFEAKFRSAASAGAGAAVAEGSAEAASPPPADDFRRIRDTERDQDPEAADEELGEDEWDKLGSEDELPTFFESVRPLMRRNQRGPGLSVGVDHLAKKWDLTEDDVLNALKECGFDIPEDEEDKPVYLEYDGDLFWVNVNRRGELWVNTKEKPRAVFRTVQATRVAPEEKAPEVQAAETDAEKPADAPEAAAEGREAREPREPRANRDSRQGGERKGESKPRPEGGAPGQPLPSGPALLDRIRPLMRRNRREAGGSGSFSFLSRALKCGEAALTEAFGTFGLVAPAAAGEKPHFVEIASELWWLNKDQRGGIWINAREKREGDAGPPVESTAPSASVEGIPAAPNASLGTVGVESSEAEAVAGPVAVSSSPDSVQAQGASAPVASGNESAGTASAGTGTVLRTDPAPAPVPGHVLAAVRLLLKETRSGGLAAPVDRLADELGKSVDDFVTALAAQGLKVPEKAREKPVFVEHAGEIFWFHLSGKGELWLNAKASKYAQAPEEDGEGGGGKRPRRPRRKKDEAREEGAVEAPVAAEAGTVAPTPDAPTTVEAPPDPETIG